MEKKSCAKCRAYGKAVAIQTLCFQRFVSVFFRFLVLLIVAVKDWRALVPTCQKLGVVVLLLDELGLQLAQEEYPACSRSCQSEEWRDRMQQKGRPLDRA